MTQTHTEHDPAQSTTMRPVRGSLVTGAGVLVLALLVGAGWVGGRAFSGPHLDNSAFLAAGSPSEKLSEAVDLTLSSGTMFVTTRSDDGTEFVAQTDYPNGIVYSELPDAQAGSLAMFQRGDEVLIRMEKAALPGVEPGVWYRTAADDTGPLGFVSAGFDPSYAKGIISTAQSVDEVGSEAIDGVDTTHFVLTVDKEETLDRAMELMGDMGTDEDADYFRHIMSSAIPDTTEYWVDGTGLLRQESDGTQTKQYHDFGARLQLPRIDEDAVRDAPGF
ncbi:hypothetical protein [Rhodococcus sp. HNM0569]|uniref:hypothetical protein n=1 Tax=Rhodococcus sp. HNM0569 TaxID=2716340 RepID=UPI00146BEA61|nr:hypothetical protein [Rhodococcus sp. HNM0569]NLU83091.1 hypothetical protein [Rhodococcus sp. HNM0569]